MDKVSCCMCGVSYEVIISCKKIKVNFNQSKEIV